MVRFEKTPEREAEIVAKTFLTKDTVKLDLQLLPDEDDNLSLDFEPGQFMGLHIPGNEDGAKRAYSLANAPNWDGSLEFLIKLRQNGQFSTFLETTAEAGKPDVYICGSPGLIESIAVDAEACGIDRSELVYERYLANSQPTGASRCEITKRN